MFLLPSKFRDERQLRSTLGVSQATFTTLLEVFSVEYVDYKTQEYEQALAAGKRKRQPGGGRKSILKTDADKLAFGLYYLKNYPTYDVLSTIFNMSRSVAYDNVQLLLPLVRRCLDELGVLPKQTFESAEAFYAYFQDKDIETLLIDVTEREHFRYRDKEKRDATYSGKKNFHREKYGHL